MSSGPFIITRYASDDGEVHPIRVQPETTSLVIDGAENTPSTAAFTSSISARVSGGKRQLGLRARGVSFRFTTPPSTGGYNTFTILRLPIFSETIWAGITKGDTGTYLGGSITVVGKYPEEER